MLLHLDWFNFSLKNLMEWKLKSLYLKGRPMNKTQKIMLCWLQNLSLIFMTIKQQVKKYILSSPWTDTKGYNIPRHLIECTINKTFYWYLSLYSYFPMVGCFVWVSTKWWETVSILTLSMISSVPWATPKSTELTQVLL